MKRSFIYILILFLGISFNNCKSTRKTTDSEKDTKKLETIALYTEPIDSLKTDYYDIDSVSLNAQALKVYVTYSGGCGEATFEMFYKPQLMTVLPHRNLLLLKLTDDDPCRELIQKELIYDLSIFKKEAKDGGVIIILDKYELLYSISED
jgi:hypothetical protein